jgi:uncharacterized protein
VINEKDIGRRPIPLGLCRDPPPDPSAPAETLPQAIPSSGINLNAVLYSAAGNVLAIHYRGSWGGPGKFTLTHCVEDAAASLDWLQDRGKYAKFRIDPKRIVIMGHSMGGFVAALTAAKHPDILGTALISGVDLTRAFGGDEGQAAGAVDQNAGMSAGLHILAGTSPDELADEVHRNSKQWHLASYASCLAGRPLLTVTSDDGFADGSNALADAVQVLGGNKLTPIHLATDHSYSDRRIELQIQLLHWLQTLPAP